MANEEGLRRGLLSGLPEPYLGSTISEPDFAVGWAQLGQKAALVRLWWSCKWGDARRQRRSRGPATNRKSAADALRQAMAWHEEIVAGNVRQADIAKREGLTRARVSQLMKLRQLPADEQKKLLEGAADASVKAALRLVGS